MNFNYENKLRKQGYQIIVGLDEAGRGAWAGPIVAGLVYIPNFRKKFLKNVKDSKLLSQSKREELFTLIDNNFIWAVGLVEAQEIDQIGIGEANKLAMTRAIKNVKIKPDFLLIDYIKDVRSRIPTQGIVDGDNKILSIAAASIMAKVFRDKLMVNYHLLFPEWQFDKHKGYGTKTHQDRLEKNGTCKLHRKSFRPVKGIA